MDREARDGILEHIQTVLDEHTRTMAEQGATLDRVLEQATLTNGRVSALETRATSTVRELFGDEQSGRAGLVQRSYGWDDTRSQMQAVILWARRTTIAFLTAALALGANLIADLI